MNTREMTDDELILYKKISSRVRELEKYIDFLDSEIPAKVIRDKKEAAELTLKANTELLKFWFGEGCLRQ